MNSWMRMERADSSSGMDSLLHDELINDSFTGELHSRPDQGYDGP
jgi:hypothetical protein